MQGLLSQEELGRNRLKPCFSNVNNSFLKNEDNNVPEFLVKKLKSPSERKAEAELKQSAQQTILRSLNRETPKPVLNPKPKVVVKPIQNGNNVHSDNDNNENQISRSGSVQRSRSFFEENGINNVKASTKPAIAPKRASLNRNKPLPVVASKPASVKKNIPVVSNIPVIGNIPPIQDFGSPDQVITEDIYDDVETIPEGNSAVLNTSSSQESVLLPPPDASLLMQEEVYDDVQNTSMEFPLPPPEVCDQGGDLYDDVGIANVPVPVVNNEAPIKVPKSFEEVSPEHMIVPFGIDKWLENLLFNNKAQLKSFVSLNKIKGFDSNQGVNAAPERIPTEDELEEDLLYDDIQATLKVDQKSEKERKREEREKAEKEKREKRERAEKEKKEKEREKKERKRKEREYKNFQLNIDSPLTYTSCVSCCKDFTPKPKDKFDLAYSTGDEIKLVVPPTSLKYPEGKILVHNINTDRVGYVSKKDFGLEDTVIESSSTVGAIPTEDEELYEDISGLSDLPPPPVPETPRPNLHMDAPGEDFYNDVKDAEQIYETV